MIELNGRQIGAITPAGEGWVKVSCIIHVDQLPQFLEVRDRINEVLGCSHPNPTVSNGIVLMLLCIEFKAGIEVQAHVARQIAFMLSKAYERVEKEDAA